MSEQGRRGKDAAIRDGLVAGLARHRACIDRLEGAPLERLADLIEMTHAVLRAGGKVLACGNGGSASDAQHFVAELVGRYLEERQPWPAVALNADGAVLTCLANDYDYERVFARQVEALGRPGDLLVGISTSGKSPSIVRALEVGRQRGLRTAALLGRDGGAALAHAEIGIVVPVSETARIQEAHGLLIHLLCEGLDRALAGESGRAGPGAGP